MMLIALLTAMLAVNLLTILRFRDDKQRAIEGLYRVPESDLLTLALSGGTLGAFYARARYRHKTRKEPFSTLLALIAAGQAGVGLSFLF